MNAAIFTDDQIKKYQKQVLQVCAFCESGIRIGIETPKFLRLASNAKDVLKELETEFIRRHPEETQKRNQQFLHICENMIDNHNFEEFGRDAAAAGTEYFTEYDTPERGMKRVTCRKFFLSDDGETRTEKTVAEYKMKPVDFLFAEIEAAMDEFADTLPDVTAGK